MAEQSLPLTKRFALFAGLIVIAASLLLIKLYKEVAAYDLYEFAARSNGAVTRVFSSPSSKSSLVVGTSHAKGA